MNAKIELVDSKLNALALDVKEIYQTLMTNIDNTIVNTGDVELLRKKEEVASSKIYNLNNDLYTLINEINSKIQFLYSEFEQIKRDIILISKGEIE